MLVGSKEHPVNDDQIKSLDVKPNVSGMEKRNHSNVKYVNNYSKPMESSNVSGMEKRNHSNVKYVNNYSMPTEFDNAAQKLNSECMDQEVSGMDDVTTEGQKPNRHPGGISEL